MHSYYTVKIEFYRWRENILPLIVNDAVWWFFDKDLYWKDLNSKFTESLNVGFEFKVCYALLETRLRLDLALSDDVSEN